MSAQIEVRTGRRATVRSDIPDWVTLAGLPPIALFVYVILAAHVNQRRGDRLAWPTQDTLARMVGLSRGDKIKQYTDKLEELGAIDIDRGGMPRRCTYTVLETPPPGYDGPMTVADWYDQAGVKEQVTPVAPLGGELDDRTLPVTPPGGELANPPGGEQVAPSGGYEQARTNNQESNNQELPLPLQDPVTEIGAQGEPEEGNNPQKEHPTLDDVVAWFGRRRPDWDERAVREALTAAVNQGRGALVEVAGALRELAEDVYGETRSPRRLLYDEGAWWAALRKSAAPAAAGPRCQQPSHDRHPADGCPLCAAEAAACSSCPRAARSCTHRSAFEPDRPEDPAAVRRGEEFLAQFQRRRNAVPVG